MTGNIPLVFPVWARLYVTLWIGILTLSLCSLPVSDAEERFPFLLSNGTCALPLHYKSMCTCITRIGIQNYESLCRSYTEMTECLDIELQSDPTSLMGKVFDKTVVLTKMEYLCNLYIDIKPEMRTCQYENESRACDNKYVTSLYYRNVTLGKNEVCGFTEAYSDCYWKVNCSARVKHFLSSSVAFYSSYTCAKHGMAITKKCIRLGKEMFPEMKRFYKNCVGFVYETGDCFIREHLLKSAHPEDVIHNIEFDVERYIRFRIFRCDIEKERDHDCSWKKAKEQKVCFAKFNNESKKQIDKFQNGLTVHVDDICRIYDDVTRCMTDIFTDCPVEGVYFNSILCASMPSSCYCPVDLHRERIARSSKASKSNTTPALAMSVSVALLTIK